MIRLLVFLVGDLIKDTKDRVWQLYLKLKVVVEYVCAPQLTSEQILNMKHLIQEYLKERCSDDFPIEMHVTIKTHNQEHFADLYEMMGPLSQLWTLRFESKHAFLSRILALARNHVNVIRTMALKDQLYSCYLSTGELFLQGTQTSNPCPLVIDKYPEPEVQLLLKKHLFTDSAVDVRSVITDEQECKCYCWILLKKEDSKITIGMLKYIICDGPDIFFILTKYSATFMHDYGIYELKEEEFEYELELLSNLVDIRTESVYEFNGKLCFALKYAMLEESKLADQSMDM